MDALLNSLFVSQHNTLNIFDVIFAMMLPMFLSFGIVWVYRHTQPHTNYSHSFVQAIFLFATLSGLTTLIVGTNLARAFGLLGALSIIRFRNAVKNPLDAVYIFWALAIGLASGAGYYSAAILGVLFAGGLMVALNHFKVGAPKFHDTILKVAVAGEKEQPDVDGIESALKTGTRNYQRTNTLYEADAEGRTYVYLIRSDIRKNLEGTLQSIRGLKGVRDVRHLNSETALFVE